jgi:hypothetical protein
MADSLHNGVLSAVGGLTVGRELGVAPILGTRSTEAFGVN